MDTPITPIAKVIRVQPIVGGYHVEVAVPLSAAEVSVTIPIRMREDSYGYFVITNAPRILDVLAECDVDRALAIGYAAEQAAADACEDARGEYA